MDDYEKWLNSGNFDSDSPEEHEEYLEEMARKERLERGALLNLNSKIPDFYVKYR